MEPLLAWLSAAPAHLDALGPLQEGLVVQGAQKPLMNQERVGLQRRMDTVIFSLNYHTACRRQVPDLASICLGIPPRQNLNGFSLSLCLGETGVFWNIISSVCGSIQHATARASSPKWDGHAHTHTHVSISLSIVTVCLSAYLSMYLYLSI